MALGKLTHKILEHEWVEGCFYINPDDIALKEFGDWNLPEAVIKAAKLSTQMREDCLINGKSLLFETVLSTNEKLEFLAKAKESGYFVRLFFVGTDNPTINASRIAQRVMNGGHDVPITKIINRYYKSVTNCSTAIKIADRSYIYDNSVNFADPKLLFRAVEGRIEKEYNPINDWALEIFNSVKSK